MFPCPTECVSERVVAEVNAIARDEGSLKTGLTATTNSSNDSRACMHASRDELTPLESRHAPTCFTLVADPK